MSANGSAQHARPPLQAPADGSLRVLVADDHDLFRSGLCELLAERGFDIVGAVADGRAALERVRFVRPDVVVIGLQLSGMPAAETARRLADAFPGVRLLGLSIAAEDHAVAEAVRAGIHSYLLKDASVEEIVEAVRGTAAGESVISPRVAPLILHRLREATAPPPLPDAGLTPREREVVVLLAAGRSNAEIADELAISRPTAKNHISSILVKLGAENRIQAAVEAVRRGWA